MNEMRKRKLSRAEPAHARTDRGGGGGNFGSKGAARPRGVTGAKACGGEVNAAWTAGGVVTGGGG